MASEQKTPTFYSCDPTGNGISRIIPLMISAAVEAKIEAQEGDEETKKIQLETAKTAQDILSYITTNLSDTVLMVCKTQFAVNHKDNERIKTIKLETVDLVCGVIDAMYGTERNK